MKNKPKEVTVEEEVSVYMVDPTKFQTMQNPVNARNIQSLPFSKNTKTVKTVNIDLEQPANDQSGSKDESLNEETKNEY